VCQNNYNLPQLCLTISLILTIGAVNADGFLSYGADLNHSKDVLQIYKYTDRNGKTTYSSSVKNDYIDVKEIAIALPPPAEYAEEARLRSLKFEKVAEELGLAREKREALREENKKKRLDRLALNTQSKSTVYEQNIYVRYPYRLWSTYRHGGHRNDNKPVPRPSVGHRTSSMNLPSSSFH
jgi:hypothetical protein